MPLVVAFALTAVTNDSPYVLMVILFVVLAFGVGFTKTSDAEATVNSAANTDLVRRVRPILIRRGASKVC